jgi:type IV pilus assembly protein PilB
MKHYVLRSLNDLQLLLGRYRNLPVVLLGEMLLYAKLIDASQLQEALQFQQQMPGRHLGQILVERGWVTPDQVNVALAQKLGIPYVRIQDFQTDSDVLHRLPPDLLMQYNALPLGEVNGKLVVAVENPFNHQATAALRFNSRSPIDLVMAAHGEITAQLSRHFSLVDEHRALEDLDLNMVSDPSAAPARDKVAAHLIEAEAQKKPIVRLLNAIIVQAISRNASDINIRPEKERVNVFYRVDGRMQFSRTLSKSLLPALVSRVKIIGQMDIAERRLPQDGHARIVRGDRHIDLRISVIPTVNGESVVIRVLDKTVGVKPLDDLGFRLQDLERLRRVLTRSQGMLLVTGPTGSGKSTTLYALLSELKRDNAHILTVEDPVEYDIEGVEQVQVSLAKGYTFAQAMRHFLRHDPDVIMVGEIRDEETAHIANKAALTGHLVLSTLHTNDAVSTVTRLVDMGVEPYLLSTTLLCVVAQRLIRLTCTHCKVKETPAAYLREGFKLRDDEVFYRGAGCYHCNYTGYKGRVTVCELLHVTPSLAEQINAGASYQRMLETALNQGMTLLVDNALCLARDGKTSLEEVLALRLD